MRTRAGTFRLLEDGTLEGEARLEYTGHWAELLRDQEDQEPAATRERELRELMSRRLPGSELSDVRIENVTDPARPYANAYKIRVPGYAQRAGNRLIVQPGVFQKGVAQVFAAAERRTGVHFPFAWSEEDRVTVEVPAGYVAEGSLDLAGIDAGAAKYGPQLSFDGSRLTYTRVFAVAPRGVLYDTTYYQAFRAFFEAVHRGDGQPVVLRKKDAR
jgi:hypothetical protein